MYLHLLLPIRGAQSEKLSLTKISNKLLMKHEKKGKHFTFTLFAFTGRTPVSIERRRSHQLCRTTAAAGRTSPTAAMGHCVAGANRSGIPAITSNTNRK